jgi:DNA-binding XRE family transcriptional regulator
LIATTQNDSVAQNKLISVQYSHQSLHARSIMGIKASYFDLNRVKYHYCRVFRRTISMEGALTLRGDELKFQRQRIGLTPENLARFAGVSVGTVERWESDGSTFPRALRLRVLLAQLELKRRELLTNATDSQHWQNWLAQHLTEEMADNEPFQER